MIFNEMERMYIFIQYIKIYNKRHNEKKNKNIFEYIYIYVKGIVCVHI